MGKDQQPPLCIEMSGSHNEAECFLNGTGSDQPSPFHCRINWHKHSKIVQKSVECGDELVSHFCNTVGRVQHSKSFFDIEEYVLRDFDEPNY